MKPKNVLGRGLDSLLGGGGPEAKRVLEVEVHRLRPNPSQPRKVFAEEALDDLTRSIAERGVLQPILVRTADEGFEIVAGERRWRASQRAGLQKVPVLVHEVSDTQMLEVALVENLQREDLNPVEEARAYRVLVEDLDLTQEEVAKRVGKERATVANALRLLHLQPPALQALEEGLITPGHAKAILSHKKKEEQAGLLNAIVARGLSVREAERYRPASRPVPAPPKADADTQAASETMARTLGLKVEIRRKGKGGEVLIRFRSEEDLHRIYEALAGR
jgi:ParB family transcriptional regulator, chromosome partitioning protein